MKRINFFLISTFLILQFLNEVQSQTFETIISNPEDEYISDVVEDCNSNFITLTQIDNTNSLYLIGTQGNIISKATFPKTDGMNTCPRRLIYDSDSCDFAGVGLLWDSTTNLASILFFRMGMDFILNDIRYYPSQYSSASLMSFQKTDTFCFTTSGSLLFPETNAFIFKVNTNFDSLKCRIFQNSFMGNGFIKDSITNGYTFFIDGFSAKRSFASYVILDSSFNDISTGDIPNKMYQNMNSYRLNPEEYLLTGNIYTYQHPTLWKDFGIQRLDNAGNVIAYQQLGKVDTFDYISNITNLAFVDTSTVFIGGSINAGKVGFHEYHPSWFNLIKMDARLNIAWERFYGGDAYYFMSNLIHTSDGGILMAGTRFDYLNPINQCDPYLLKVDSEGLITMVPEPNPGKPQEAILCPNPGSECIFAIVGHQYQEATLTLHTLSGRVVMVRTLTEYQTNINTAFLTPGSYLYTFHSDSKVIGSGIWIKQ